MNETKNTSKQSELKRKKLVKIKTNVLLKLNDCNLAGIWIYVPRLQNLLPTHNKTISYATPYILFFDFTRSTFVFSLLVGPCVVWMWTFFMRTGFLLQQLNLLMSRVCLVCQLFNHWLLANMHWWWLLCTVCSHFQPSHSHAFEFSCRFGDEIILHTSLMHQFQFHASYMLNWFVFEITFESVQSCILE